MKQLYLKLFLITLILSSLLSMPIKGSPTNLYLFPSKINVKNVGDQFPVQLKIENVSSLWSWKASVVWNPTILRLVNITQGPFLNSSVGSIFLTTPSSSRQGAVEVSCTRQVREGVTGSGLLATLNFKMISSTLSSNINVSDVLLFAALQQSGTSHPTINTNSVGTEVKITPSTTNQTQASIYLSPNSNTIANVSDVIKYTLKIKDVKNLFSWKVSLLWDQNVLDLVNATEGPMLKKAGPTLFLKGRVKPGNLTEISCTQLYTPGQDGSGDLATFTFLAKTPAINSPLQITADILHTAPTDYNTLPPIIMHSSSGAQITLVGTTLNQNSFTYLPLEIGAVVVIFAVVAIIYLQSEKPKKGVW